MNEQDAELSSVFAPFKVGGLIIGGVDEVNGPESVQVNVPISRHEAKLIAQHWLERRERLLLWYYEYEQACSTDSRILAYVGYRVRILQDSGLITPAEIDLIAQKIRLPNRARWATIEAQRQGGSEEYLQMLMAALAPLGLDVNATLDRMMPKTVAPDERLSVPMSTAEKALVLGLTGLDDDISKQITLTPPWMQTVALTLRQVTMLENLVASVAKTCTDEQLVHKWRDIENHLIDVQVHYTDGSEPSLEEALAGQPISQGALMRQTLMRMMEERKKVQS